MRNVTAVNKIGAQIGDEVNFELPDMIDIFAMFRHLVWPFIISLVVTFAVRLAIQSNIAGLSSSALSIATLITAIISFFIAFKVLKKRGIIKADAISYTIEIKSIITK